MQKTGSRLEYTVENDGYADLLDFPQRPPV